MKRVAFYLLVVCLVLSLVACGNKSGNETINSESVANGESSVVINEEENPNQGNEENSLLETQAKDLFDHIMAEDWQYLYDHFDIGENSVIFLEDIQYIFKSHAKTNEITSGKLTMGEQDYVIKEVKPYQTDDGNDAFRLTLSNSEGTRRAVLDAKSTGNTASDYIIYKNTSGLGDDFIKLTGVEYPESASGFGGQFLVVPADFEDLTLRGVKIKEEWRDDSVLDIGEKSEDSLTKFEKKYCMGGYKAYRLFIPYTYLNIRLQDQKETIEASKTQFGYELGDLQVFEMTAKTASGTFTADSLYDNLIGNRNGVKDVYMAENSSHTLSAGY